MTRGAWFGSFTGQGSVGVGGGAGAVGKSAQLKWNTRSLSDIPNPDISRDVRVLMREDPNDYADGTYYMHPGSIANGDPYFGGLIDTTITGGSDYFHPFNASKPRNGHLRIAPWIPGSVEYDGNLQPVGSGFSLGDYANGGSLGQEAYSGPDANKMNGTYRTILEGFRWINGGFLGSGADRIMLRLNYFTFPMANVLLQFAQVSQQLGFGTPPANPDTTYPWDDVYDNNLWKRNANAPAIRCQGSPSAGACGRIRSLCNDFDSMPNDARFWGGASGVAVFGDRVWNNKHSTIYAPGKLFGDKYHSDIDQFIGGEGTSAGRGGQCIFGNLTNVACNDVELSAEVGSISVQYGDNSHPELIWNMDMQSAAYIIDASHGYGVGGILGVQWYAAGRSPFGGGYSSDFDDVAIIGSPSITRNFSHLKPAALRMSGNVATDAVTDLIVAQIGPADDFRRAHPSVASLDAFCSAMGFFD